MSWKLVSNFVWWLSFIFYIFKLKWSWQLHYTHTVIHINDPKIVQLEQNLNEKISMIIKTYILSKLTFNSLNNSIVWCYKYHTYITLIFSNSLRFSSALSQGYAVLKMRFHFDLNLFLLSLIFKPRPQT